MIDQRALDVFGGNQLGLKRNSGLDKIDLTAQRSENRYFLRAFRSLRLNEQSACF